MCREALRASIWRRASICFECSTAALSSFILIIQPISNCKQHVTCISNSNYWQQNNWHSISILCYKLEKWNAFIITSPAFCLRGLLQSVSFPHHARGRNITHRDSTGWCKCKWKWSTYSTALIFGSSRLQYTCEVVIKMCSGIYPGSNAHRHKPQPADVLLHSHHP